MTKPKPKPIITSTPGISDYIRSVACSELPEDCVLFLVAMVCAKMDPESDEVSGRIEDDEITAISKRLGWHINKTMSVIQRCAREGFIGTSADSDKPHFAF